MAAKMYNKHLASRVVILHVVMLQSQVSERGIECRRCLTLTQNALNYIKTGGDPNIVDDVNEELEDEGKQLLLEYQELCEKKGVPCEVIEDKATSPMHR